MKSSMNNAERRSVEAILMVFSEHQYLADFFFEESKEKIRFRPDEMKWRAQDLSSSEQVLVRIALDIWSGSGDAKVWELLEVLDKQNFISALRGLSIIKDDRSWPYE